MSSSQAWTGSASGKVILLGEHAVVYGVPAMVGIERGARAHASSITASAGATQVSELVLGNTIRAPEDTSDVAQAFAALLMACGVVSPVRVDVTTDLPAAAGLGCSAALGVAIVRALDAWQKRPLAPPAETIERALAWEKIFHGNPSGIDATAAARGGCLFYQRLEAGPVMKEIRLGGALTLAIGHTGTASSTRAMVELVAKLRERKKDLVKQSFEGIASLVQSARLALEAHDKVGLGRLLDLNQMILSGLMLSTEEIEAMCRLARDAGALGAKLTGSGGGGCVVALAGENPGAHPRFLGESGVSLLLDHGRSSRPGSSRAEGIAMRAARAVAHPNIALSKYWGKIDGGQNLPAVPSLSLTLDAMSTTTRVEFRSEMDADQVVINGAPATADEARRITQLLDRVRSAAGIGVRASVETANDFPTASGLASSASGFAALALAATKAAGLDWDAAKVSDLARRSSVSAARSVYGGFVTLAVGTPGAEFLAAEPLADASDWPIAMCVAVTTLEKKEIGSTDGMAHTKATSPYYAAWISKAPELFERARRAVVSRDLEALGTCAEESAFAMHATAMTAAPALIYFSPATLAAVLRVQKVRREGTLAFVTIDAGPHVKVLSSAADAPRVRAALREVEGVRDVLVARPGRAASLVGDIA